MPFPALAVSAAFFMPAVAIAEPPCGPRGEILARLERAYQERRTAIAATNGRALVEVLASKDGGTWTILVTAPNGQSCVVAAGEGWRALNWKEEGPEA